MVLSYTFSGKIYNKPGSIYLHEIAPPLFNIENNESYNVIYDGNIYKNIIGTSMTTYAQLGSTSDYPFSFAIDKGYSYPYMYIYTKDDKLHTISVYQNKEEVTKLPVKFIPNEVAKKTDLDTYVKNTQYATTSQAGLVRPNKSYGTEMNGQHIMISAASESDISQKFQNYRPITPYRLDYAVKSGMTTNTLKWTEEEKQSARDLIGASDSGVEITDGEPTKENTVLTVNPNAEEVNLYTAEEIDAKLQNLPSGGSGGDAIIDVIALPTENIKEDSFYRLLTGKLVINQVLQNMYKCYCVETLPEVGEPATNIEQTEGNVYYNLADGELYGYVDDILSMGLSVPTGWYTASVLLEALGYSYNGVITDIMDDPCDNTFRLLLEYEIYSYKESKWTSHKAIGKAGTGRSAEVFNHPSNRAEGECSHAEGCDTKAKGDFSHAEGRDNIAEGDISHAEGYGSHAEGSYSHAEGSNSHAEGDSSHAEGDFSHAEGNCSHAEGNATYAGEYASHAEGSHSRAEGNYSHAEGYYSYANEEASHAEGHFTHAEGYYSHAEGENSYAEGYASHAEGENSCAEGYCSHAEGSYSYAEGNQSHAEGLFTHAKGNQSHAEGYYSHAEGAYSHAEGHGIVYNYNITGEANTKTYTLQSSINVNNLIIGASVRYDVNDSIYNTAKIVSIDKDNLTITLNRTLSAYAVFNGGVKIYVSGMALGDNSHSEGGGTIATGRSQHTQGEYNIIDPEYDVNDNDKRGKYAHIVGNGRSHLERSNAHTLDWSGNAEYQGDVKANACGGENPISLVETWEKVNDKQNKNVIINISKATVDGTTTYSADKTFAEIESAVAEGKEVIAKFNATYLHMVQHNVGTNMYFHMFNRGNIMSVFYEITKNDNVNVYTDYIQGTSNKVNVLGADSTDTQYPSAKAVVDYVNAMFGSYATEVASLIGGIEE